jgi:glycosyl transferase family 2
MTPWLSVVIPTVGRETLEHTLTSLTKQPESAGVEIVVVGDTFGGYSYELMNARTLVESEGFRWLECDAGLHCVGQPQRTFGMKQARAPWVWFGQDDDVAAQDSLAAIEMAIDAQPHPRPLFFRMQTYWGARIWGSQQLMLGNIDADCLVFPRHIAERVEWGLRYEGDFDAALQAYNFSGGDVAWLDELVSIARPSEDMLWWQR